MESVPSDNYIRQWSLVKPGLWQPTAQPNSLRPPNSLAKSCHPAITKIIIAKEGREMEICDNNVCHKVHRFLLVLFLDTQHTIISIWSLCFQYTKRRELWVAYALDESSMRLIIKSLLVKLPHGFILVFRGQVYTFVHLCGLGRSPNPRLLFSA